jgi:hypothetical protein
MSQSLLSKMFMMKLQKAGLVQPPAKTDLVAAKPELHGLRLGAMVDLSGALAQFEMGAINGSLLSFDDMETQVIGEGVSTNRAASIYKFYLNDKTTLEIVKTKDGIRDQPMIWKQLTEVNPQSPEEWDLWLEGVESNVDGLDGQPPLLTGPTIAWDGQDYGRFYFPNATGKVSPIENTETLYNGNVSQTLQSQSMVFFRRLDDEEMIDYLRISVIKCDDERWIEAHVGQPIPFETLKFRG